MFGYSEAARRKKARFRRLFLACLQSLIRTHFLNEIDFPIDKKSLIVDMGCGVGRITRSLSLRAETIGLDIDKNELLKAKKCNKHIEFICCDIYHLPLRKASVDIAVCKSVLEHIESLEKALEEIKSALKNRGKLLAGYPIETRLLEVTITLFWSWESYVWSFYKAMKDESFLRNPRTHKQNYLGIRKMLKKHFLFIKSRKIPKNWFPDFLSFYESVVLVRE